MLALPWLNGLISRQVGHVLLYHATYRIVPKNIQKGLHNVTPQVLREQLTWYKKYFDFVHLDEILTTDFSGKVAVTFDDAYESVFEEALPLLEELRVPCTIFVNGASCLGRPLWRDKVRFIITNELLERFSQFAQLPKELTNNYYKGSKNPKLISSKKLDLLMDQFFQNEGIEVKSLNFCVNNIAKLRGGDLVRFGNHGFSHYILSSLSYEEQLEEIKKNHEMLQGLGTASSKIFSVPFGGLGDFNSNTVEILEGLKYQGILLSRNRFNRDKNVAAKAGSLPMFERYMVNPSFSGLQKQLLKLRIKGLVGG